MNTTLSTEGHTLYMADLTNQLDQVDQDGVPPNVTHAAQVAKQEEQAKKNRFLRMKGLNLKTRFKRGKKQEQAPEEIDEVKLIEEVPAEEAKEPVFGKPRRKRMFLKMKAPKLGRPTFRFKLKKAKKAEKPEV
mmetsp:Transcript_14483/g.20320  ORF Transcript_14483/g.20320 Transcript_14483/m.20320 type:complete len:133 (+) Transcript_14483:126-524(+)